VLHHRDGFSGSAAAAGRLDRKLLDNLDLGSAGAAAPHGSMGAAEIAAVCSEAGTRSERSAAAGGACVVTRESLGIAGENVQNQS
jgi:hypothetical protein